MHLAKKTKIFCTMGPACWDVNTLVDLIDAGMNTARFNFSHGDHNAHGACLERVREAAALRPNQNIGILLDTKGPEIRTGFFKAEKQGKIHLKAGAKIEITTDYSFKGDETKFAPHSESHSSLCRHCPFLIVRICVCVRACLLRLAESLAPTRSCRRP